MASPSTPEVLRLSNSGSDEGVDDGNIPQPASFPRSESETGDSPAPNVGSVTNYRSFQNDARCHVNNNNNDDSDSESEGGGEGDGARSQFRAQFPPNPNFRGFSTSINGMFEDVKHERADCCAMACCGVLQSDRNRYLVTGVRPPSFFKRFWAHIVFPVALFLLAGYSAMAIPDLLLNYIFSCFFLFSSVALVITQCFKGQHKRLMVRRDLLWVKHNFLRTGTVPRDHPDDQSLESERQHTAPPDYYMGQTRADLRHAHAPLSFYAADQLVSPHELSEFDARAANEDPKINLCTKFNRCFGHMCCGALCGMHLQLCGVCAIAQETREIDALLPSSRKRIDYISLQPMLEYYPKIYRERHGVGPGTDSWWRRLSSFSQTIVTYSGGFIMLLLAWSFVSPIVGYRFGPKNFVVFCATLLQALVLITIVYWKHTKDVSPDAIIKFFACGFFLSTTIAVFFEVVLGLVIRTVMTILIAISGVDVVVNRGFSMPSMFAATPYIGRWMEAQEYGSNNGYREYLSAFGNDHPIVYTLYLMVSAFCLAALIEEMAKYYGFRILEHPDFLSENDLLEASDEYSPSPEEQQRERAEAEELDEQERQQQLNPPNFSLQNRSLKSRGAAITVSMVAVGLGFACCENLVYVFIYSESSLSVQIAVLCIRSLFPIHPVAAALQSIRVCQRDLEGDKKMKLEQIITPAVILHGSFDFMLLWIDFLVERHGTYVTSDDDATVSLQSNASGLVSFVVSFSILIAALLYYRRESRAQNLRFAAFDGDSNVDQSSLI